MKWNKKGMAFLLAITLAGTPVLTGVNGFANELTEDPQPIVYELDEIDGAEEAPAQELSGEAEEPSQDDTAAEADKSDEAVSDTSETEINETADEQTEDTNNIEETGSDSAAEDELSDEDAEEELEESEMEETTVGSDLSKDKKPQKGSEKKKKPSLKLKNEIETPSAEEEEEVIEVEARKPIDEVKSMISTLKGEPLNVTFEDAAQIKRVGIAYSGLSAEDRAQLDNDQCMGILSDGVGTSQSYGRVLEACQWALNSLEIPDTSTSLEEGVYTTKTDPAVSSTSDKGKSTSGRTRYWTVDQLIVDANHNAKARISVNSETYDLIQCAGGRYERLADSEAGYSSFLVPIDPNGTFYILGHSTVMPSSIAYKVTCSITEPVVVDQNAKVTFTVADEKGAQIKNAVVKVNSGNTVPVKGLYELLKGAKYTVQASADGYQSKTVTYTASEDENYVITLVAADRLVVKVEDQNTGTSVNATIKVALATGKKTAVDAYRTGEYFLTRGEKYQITVTADGYKKATKTITSKGDLDLTIQLEKKEKPVTDTTPKAVKKVIKMIAELPSNPTEADRAAIIKAQKAYIALDTADEAKVTNSARLEAIYNKLGPKKPAKGAGTYTFKDQTAGSGRGSYQAESIQTSTQGQSMFRVVNVVLRVDESGKMVAEITLSGTGYRNLYMGTSTDAFEAEEAAGGFKHCANTKGIIKGEPVSYQDNDGKHSAYRFTIPVESLDHPILIAAQSWAHDSGSADKTTAQRREMQGDGSNSYSSIWFQRAIILSSKHLVKSSSDSEAEENGPVEERDDGDDINEDPENTRPTGPGSGSQTVGQYAFSWSGGTMGHVLIQCLNVEVRDGQAYVTISFVRKASVGGTAKFSQVTSCGQTISGNNVFTIPVNLNANTPIEAYTTAMSQGHWVHYTIYVGVNDQSILEKVGQEGEEAGAIETTVGKNTTAFDKEAPEIIGLKGGKEVKLQAAKLLKIFQYDDGYYLIEVDLGTKPVPAQQAKQTEEKKVEKTAEIEEEAAEAGEGQKDNSKYRDESIGRAYQNRIVKYLVVPEEKEVPVGLEEMVVLVQEPVSKLYVSSISAMELLDKNKDTDKIASVGIKETESLPESIASRMEADGEDQIQFFGTYDDWKLKKMIKYKTDLIIEDERIIPQDKNDLEKEQELYKKLTSRANQMETAVFIDRSGSEEDEDAAKDWKMAYQILLGSVSKESK